MSILIFPTLSRTPSGASFRLRGNTQTHRSPLDGTTQTLEMPGARWELTVRWDSLAEADHRTLGAFLARLRGQSGRFTFSPAIFAPRRGTATGTPVFLTAPASGETFTTEGWTPSSGSGQVAGDWLSYADTGGRVRLHLAVADHAVDGSGECSHTITPPIRRAGTVGQAVEVIAPIGVFMLAEDVSPDLEIRPPRLGSVTLSMVEALI